MNRPKDTITRAHPLDSSAFYKLLLTFRQKMFWMVDHSLLKAYACICAGAFIRFLKLLTDGRAVVYRCSGLLWENSYSKKISRKMQAVLLRAHLSPGLPWQRLLEGLILLLIMLMPVLSLWWYLLPLLVLLFLTSSREPKVSVSGRKEILSGAGLWMFGVVLLVSAAFSGGFKTGISALVQWGTWLCLSWMVYLTFSQEFCIRVLKYILSTSLIWLAAGYGQLYAGLPTPTGWLGTAQSAVINLRIYSVFGNPNIYGLYLLSILILSGFFIEALPVSPGAKGQSRWFKYYSVLIAGLTLGALYFTYSRTAWIIAGVIILVWAWRGGGRLRARRGLFFSLLIFAILSILPGFKARVDSLAKFSDSSFSYRVRIWEGVARALKDFWAWGIGPAKFQTVYPLYQIGDTTSQHAHQLYLQLWLENGLFSLIAFGRLMKNLFSGIRFPQTPYLGPLVIMLIVFLNYGFSETWWMNRFCGGYFWLLAGLLMSLKYKGPVGT